MDLSGILGSPTCAPGYHAARPRHHPRGVRREPAVAAVRGWHVRAWAVVGVGLLLLLAPLVASVVLTADWVSALAAIAIVLLVVALPVALVKTAASVTVGPDWLLVGGLVSRAWVDLGRLRSVSLPTPADSPVCVLSDRDNRVVRVDIRLLLGSQPVRDALANGLTRSVRNGMRRDEVVTALASTLGQPLAGVTEVRVVSERLPPQRSAKSWHAQQKHRSGRKKARRR